MSNSLLDFVLLRSDGPIFDRQITLEDLAGTVLTGIVPSDGYMPPEDAPGRILRPIDCVRGTGHSVTAPHHALMGKTTPTQ